MKNVSVLFVPTLFLLSALPGGTQLASAASELWTGGGADAKWSTPGNWSGPNLPPVAGDSLSFGLSSQTTPDNDLAVDTPFNGLTFTAGAAGLGYNLNGFSVLLSGQAFANTIGIVNNSGTAQSVGTMPLDLDWGYYTFSSPSGSLALNSTLTLNYGAVAYFGANLTSSLAADGTTGLIPVLNGAGLIWNGSKPTGLATIDGSGNILAYSAYTTYTAAATFANTDNNIQINTIAFPANTTYTANGLLCNTISTTQTGNSGGSAVDVIQVNGAIHFADKGGFYALNAAAGAKNCLYIGSPGSGAMTAGPGDGSHATLVFAVNGDNANNQVAVNSFIWDYDQNIGGQSGTVTVETVGTGSVFFGNTSANAYSGGTYVLQGQLQGQNGGSFGTGPIYVAAGATVWLNAAAAATFPNDLYLSSGNGTPIEGIATGNGLPAGTSYNPGALLVSYTTCSGKLTLLGNPVTYPTVGCRITGNKDAGASCNLNGQITGTGTLELYCAPHAMLVFLNNPNTSGPSANDWQGGLIIQEWLAAPSSARNITVKLGFDNQIPHGTSAGDVKLYEADTSSKNSLVRLDLNGHNNTINGLNASAAGSTLPQLANFGSAPSVLTMGDNNASGTFNGVATDSAGPNSLSLAKIGNGMQTMSGTAAFGYHGNTTVNAGTLALAVGGQIPNSPVITVASGATLDASGLTVSGLAVGSAQTLAGLGTVNGTTVISGTVNPFLNTIGALANNGTVTLNGGGTYVWDIDKAASTAGFDPGWSQINITGGLTIAATSGSPFTINLTSLTAGDVAGPVFDFDNTANYEWSIIKTTTGITGFDPSKFVLNTAGFANSLGDGQFFIDRKS